MAIYDRDYDAVVVGAGHNGLVAALYLARAGYSTLVLERDARLGGAVQSAEITRPGFVHDLYATNLSLFLGSAVHRELGVELARHGLQYAVSATPYASAFPNGQSLRVYQDLERTVEGLSQHDPADGLGWRRLYEQFRLFKRHLLPLTGQPMPSLQAAGTLLAAAGRIGISRSIELAQIIVSSTRELADAYFATAEAKALIAAWGMHPDFGPDVSGGAMFPFVEAFADMENGIAIARGGASALPEALAGLIRESGGEVRAEAEVVQVLTTSGRADGVELATGERIGARHVVIANVTPTVLFGRLLSDCPLPADFRHKAAGYSYGPGTMMIHLALGEPPRWNAGDELGRFAYVHVAPYVDDLSRTYAQALAGYLPDSPLLIVGQTSAVDPGRAPAGRAVLWVQVRLLPAAIRGDAAGQIAARDWDEAKERYADRVIAKLAEYAPNIRDAILERVVLSPLDLERANPNLHGGDSIAGSMHLRQNFFFRPFPGWSTYLMPLSGLYIVGAATWPGPGTNATSGYLAAQAVLNPRATRGRLVGGGAALGLTAAAALGLRRLRR